MSVITNKMNEKITGQRVAFAGCMASHGFIWAMAAWTSICCDMAREVAREHTATPASWLA